jgi:hypothetical protein
MWSRHRWINPGAATSVIVLLLGCTSQGRGYGQKDTRDGGKLSAESTVASAANSSDSLAASGKPSGRAGHSVKLTWNTSVPASKSARDAILGYKVYRSTKPHDRDARALNANPVAGSEYTDSTVEPGLTYYYVTKAVSVKGAESNASNEMKVEIPHR